MTREDLNRANEIVREINQIDEIIKTFSESEKLYLAPEKVVLDDGFTPQYIFAGRLKDEIITVLINERNRLEEELARL